MTHKPKYKKQINTHFPSHIHLHIYIYTHINTLTNAHSWKNKKQSHRYFLYMLQISHKITLTHYLYHFEITSTATTKANGQLS